MKFAAFNQGTTPTIVVVNQAKTPLGLDLAALVAALQEYVDKHVAPVWGTPAKLVLGTKPQPGCWLMTFLDNADEAGALAYHDLTADGLPLLKVFVKTILDAKESLSSAAAHELVEALVDPSTALAYWIQKFKAWWAAEPADPVEETSFKINGFDMSNFVYPAWYEALPTPGIKKYDELGLCTKPLQILKGGYQIQSKKINVWTNIFGSAAKSKRFAREDRRGHRSESRGTVLKRARKSA